jgi:hypothetical protein
MLNFSQFLNDLAKAKNLDDLNRLEAEFQAEENKPDFLLKVKKLTASIAHLDPALGIPFLIRLYDSDDSYDRDELIRAAISRQWVEGMQFLIDQDPKVVNFAWDGVPLLMHAANKITNQQFILMLLKAKPNLALYDSHGNTLLHLFAINGCKDQQVLDYVLNNADLALFNMKNKSGKTPLMLNSSQWSEEVFIPQMKETIIRRFGQEALNKILEEALNRAALSAIGERYLSATPSEREAYLREMWTAEVPPLTPVMMLTNLIGKGMKREANAGVPMNVRLFLNIAYLAQYIKTMAKDTQEDFIVNGILMPNSTHAVNVFCIKSNNTLSFIVIDSLGGLDREIRNLLKDLEDTKLTIQSIRLRSAIQFTSVGCKVIASYLAEKLSRLTVESAKALYDTLQSKDSGLSVVSPTDFPLWLGILAIAQSMPFIEAEKKVLSKSHLESPVNKRGETFDTLLAYGLAKKHSPDYYNRENPLINKTINRKAAHQGEHALKTLSMTDEKIMESMAKVLGLDVTSKDWREELKSLEADLGDWEKLHKREPGL